MTKLIKTLAAAILVAVLVLGSAVPSLAADPPRGEKRQPEVTSRSEKDREHGEFSRGKTVVIRGTVDNITGSIISVDGKPVTTNSDTKVKLSGLGRDATVADIKAGMQIVAQGTKQGTDFVARQILAVPGKPEFVHRVGTVIAFSNNSTGGSITVQDKKGDNTTFKILPGQFKVLPAGSEVKVGDKVTVISHRNPATNEVIASGVVIHRPETDKERPEAKLQSASGNVTALTSTNITVGSTVIGYDANTVFVLKGLAGTVNGDGVTFTLVGQSVTVFYVTDNSTSLAKAIVAGTDLPKAIRELLDEHEDKD